MSQHNDIKLVRWLGLLLLLPLTLAVFSGDRFRYPCQDPANWDKDMCKFPVCDVTRTCPEHIFKGQRDPRLGPPKDDPNKTDITPMASIASSTKTQGANCGK
jgi:hypothetical protein